MQMRFFVLAFMLFTLSSCKVFYPNYLFRDTKDFFYYELQEVEYQKQIIMPYDRISFSLFTRDGFSLIDVLGGSGGGGGGGVGGGVRGGGSGGGGEYLVKEDGYVELPLLGELFVKGLSRLELENLLEDKYSVWFNSPFIQLTVTNRRAYVFIGVGRAQVVPLIEENTRLLEVIAMLGGLGSDTKSNKIKIIRGDYNSPSIKRIDLSTIAGLKDANFVVQPQDIIIIDARLRPGQVVSREINNFFMVLTTFTTLYLLILSFTKQ